LGECRSGGFLDESKWFAKRQNLTAKVGIQKDCASGVETQQGDHQLRTSGDGGEEAWIDSKKLKSKRGKENKDQPYDYAENLICFQSGYKNENRENQITEASESELP
jgi:hypothetical protein